MKKMKFLLTALCVALMLFGVITTASALSITPGDYDWIWTTPNPTPFPDPQYNNPDAAVVSYVTGNTVQELYKQDQGSSADLGPFALSYKTEFFNEPSDPEEAKITYVSGPVISGSPLYLLVKDGAASNPIWYLFDITGWNGQDDIEMTGFWPQQGAISHVSLYGPSPVPIPAAVWLLGSGLLGLVGIRRKFKK